MGGDPLAVTGDPGSPGGRVRPGPLQLAAGSSRAAPGPPPRAALRRSVAASRSTALGRDVVTWVAPLGRRDPHPPAAAGAASPCVEGRCPRARTVSSTDTVEPAEWGGPPPEQLGKTPRNSEADMPAASPLKRRKGRVRSRVRYVPLYASSGHTRLPSSTGTGRTPHVRGCGDHERWVSATSPHVRGCGRRRPGVNARSPHMRRSGAARWGMTAITPHVRGWGRASGDDSNNPARAVGAARGEGRPGRRRMPPARVGGRHPVWWCGGQESVTGGRTGPGS